MSRTSYQRRQLHRRGLHAAPGDRTGASIDRSDEAIARDDADGDRLRQVNRHALCRVLSGDANVHRAILTGGYDQFLTVFMQTAHEHGLPITDCEPVYQWLNRNRPRWIHEMRDGTIVDEQGFPVAHPDAEDLAAAADILAARRSNREGAQEIAALLRNRSRLAAEREAEQAARRAAADPTDPTY